ncbi:hypothetical protein MTP06_03770 [Streptomyces sp. PLM4]|nr:hypothetical protein MTP06_03770 [Streptomyces sp. PLM4]
MDAVGGDAVVAQERAGGRGGGRFRGDAHRSVSLCSEPRTRARGMVGRYRSRAGKVRVAGLADARVRGGLPGRGGGAGISYRKGPGASPPGHGGAAG